MGFFSGKVVIVTGSSNGIGRATAVLFVKAGAKVTITGRKEDALDETKRLCLHAGAKADDILEILGDITSETFNDLQLVLATVRKFGRLDVLVSNAGGLSFDAMGKTIMDLPVA